MSPSTIQQAFDLAFQHHRAGRLPDAERLYRQVIAADPSHAYAHLLLGIIALNAGHSEAAVELMTRAIALQPNFAEAHNNLGIAHRAMGRLDDAIAAYRKAIAIAPGYAEAHCNLGNALRDTGQLDAALLAQRQAITLKPALAEAHYNLGTVLNELGRREEAIAAYRQAITLQPALAQAHNNLGRALRETGHPDEAIAACRQAIALNPALHEAHNNLGNALADVGRLDDAVAAYRQAITLKPDDAQAHSNLLLTLNYHPAYDAKAIAGELRSWSQRHAEPLLASHPPFSNDRSPDRRLRIGYVSSDLCAHASALFLAPLLENHDANRVELFAYAQVARPDEITRRLMQCFARYRSTVGLSDEQVAAQIREDRIDILVDLKLHTSDNRLRVLARKPAPVQVTWLGYPGSTGLSTIDYRLTDPYLDPPGIDESVYTERTVRLPHSFWCYDPLDGRDLPVNMLPASQTTTVTFGSLNAFCKINDALLRLWASVLRLVPGSRLLMLAPEGSARRSTLERFQQEGIAADRIEFVAKQPRRNYLELYHRIDIALDTFPCNGHTTSLDAFWMGVPVVTLVGSTPLGRAGFSQLMNLQSPELIAHTPDQFVQIASALANDRPRLADLRSSLRPRMEQSPLMDAPAFARAIEQAYQDMWRQWLQRRPPL